MPRALFALLAVSTALSPSALGAGARPSSAANVTSAAPAKIALRGRQGDHGPWRTYLWLKLVKVEVISFSVCAIWNRPSPSPSCRAPRGTSLPRGTTLRLEQRRSGPGWKTVGLSTDAALQAVLSNTVSGNRLGTVSYRVTWRNASGRVLATSNTFKVFWTR